MSNSPFLPNHSFKQVLELVANAGDEKLDIIYSTSAYENRKEWVSKGKTKEFKYPLIRATNKDGPRMYYSSTMEKGMFGVPKVIFGSSGINLL